MRRDNEFERYKIVSVSTNKAVTNVYLDSFAIEKVRFQNFNYQDKTSIDFYLDFSAISLLAEDLKSGRFIKQLDQGPKLLAMGGTKKSDKYNGQPEARNMSIGKMNETIFINMASGPGKLSDTGLIIMDKTKVDKKISVSMSIDDFRRIFIYTKDFINAYLVSMVNALVKEANAKREEVQKERYSRQ